MFCYKCGSKLIEGAKFCSSCGQAIDNDNQKTIRRDLIPNSNNINQVTNAIRYDKYGYPIYKGNQTPVLNRTEALGIASFVLGIFSIIFCFFMPIAILLGIFAITFGIMQIKKRYSIGIAIAGISTAVFGILLAIVIVAFTRNWSFNKFDTNTGYDSEYDYNYYYDYDYDDVKSKNL